MEMHPPRRILERPRPAQVPYPVLIKETANLLRSFRRRFRRCQPPLHFRAEIIERFDGIRLQSSLPEKPQMFAQWQHSNMRRITQFFPTVLVLRSLPMLARKNILHQHRASRPAHARHLAHDSPGLLHVVQRQAADHHVKILSFERQVLRIPDSKRNIGQTVLRRALFPNRQHRRRQIHPNHFPRGSRKGFRDVPGPRRNVQDALLPLQLSGRHQPPNSLLVRNPRIRRKRLRLRREGFADHVIVLRHDSAFPAWEENSIVTEYLTYTPIEWEGYTPYNQMHSKRRSGTGPVSD